ncbi:hypothetical protein [Candidatus Rhabdochlamydia porcellionis]|jgi:hypothetical protein|uniref:Uncharacterized protein n=1 Tax=Candidatus Rhabdochlamydia porcellionis TaxID=225148 RepID=A0ABX8YZM3_9BACT|nr:hypothetical protein [Candidatus Rhabdochlamydia porcellionis]QZA58855.1 hypothetical protein RHAB15C_0000734 [Candidatus Rhabdochlamydia porcellionis]
MLHIPKEEQKTLQLTLPEVFSCTIEFCKIFNKYFNTKIGYPIDLLESMRKDPESYKREWAIWQGMVTKITNDFMNKENYFNWLDQLCPWKAE